MARLVADSVEQYCSHFDDEYAKILKIEDRLHRKILAVTYLAALARGRYPTIEGDKARFVKLIEDHADWPDARSVSIPQLLLRVALIQSQKPQSHGLSDGFVKRIDLRVAHWHSKRHVGSIDRTRIDPDISCLMSPNLSQREVALLEDSKHSALLYHFRSTLVHEFREAGHGFEVSDNSGLPYYMPTHDLDTDSEVCELVYPTAWFLSLPSRVLRNLKAHYLDNSIDPYDSYKFGSPWRQ